MSYLNRINGKAAKQYRYPDRGCKLMFYKHAIVTLLILKHCNKVSNMKHDALRELYM